MSLRAIAPGPLATIQDRGRPGYRSFGVPASGPFDRASAAIANALVGNDPDAAVIEMTAFGGTFEAESPLALAMAGAPMRVAIHPSRPGAHVVPPGGMPTKTWACDSLDAHAHEDVGMPPMEVRLPASFRLLPGDRLSIGSTSIEWRAYLAVLGGWDAPIVMGSRSSERPLRPGDVVRAAPSTAPTRRTDLGRIEDEDRPIRILDGPDSDRIPPDSWAVSRFVVSGRSDRMGLRLEGDPIATRPDPERLSTPVSFGAIQVAGDLPIVLGPAGGTMGGYPQVAQVISADLDRLGQLRPGQEVRFERVGLADARRADRERRTALRDLLLVLSTMAGAS